MGQAKSQICAVAIVLILSGVVAACDDGTVTVTYSTEDTGRNMPQPERATREICYGIAQAQYNDGTAGCLDCAGTAPKDYMPDTWKYVPAGRCAQLGGSLSPRKASE
jgi:uncharacterized membrane protein